MMRAAEVNTKPWVVIWEFFLSLFFQTVLRRKMVLSDGEQTHGLVNPRKICSLLQNLLRNQSAASSRMETNVQIAEKKEN